MTGADTANEQVAQRLASRGRDALVERLRLAYAQAAEVHADVLSIDGDRLETIVQGAADRADGLQWRRALADVASGELGISLTDALAHPAVARAQELVGAPSYEDSLAALSRRPAQLHRETSRNGGDSQTRPQDARATESESRGDLQSGPAVESQPSEETPGEETPGEETPGEDEPRWKSMAHPDALEAEPQDAGERESGEPLNAEPDNLVESEADEPGEADEPPEPVRPAAGPSAPPDYEPETIVQAAPERPEAVAPPREPATDRESLHDPQATQEWGPHEVAEAARGHQEPVAPPAHSRPPQPTHAVPAPPPLPPETTAGGHAANGESGPLVSEYPAGARWDADEPGYDDDHGVEDYPDAQRDGLYVSQGEEQDRLRVTAIHLGGVANLPREGIELRLSANGLDILRGDDEILGRLVWSEIDALEVPSSRVRRRRNRDRGRLIVRTSHGDASFEVPGFSSDELNERIAPLFARFGRH